MRGHTEVAFLMFEKASYLFTQKWWLGFPDYNEPIFYVAVIFFWLKAVFYPLFAALLSPSSTDLLPATSHKS